MKYKALVAASFAALLLYVAVFAQSAMSGTVIKNANLRAGPGTNYAIVGTAKQGQTVTIVGKNTAGNWYHLDSNKWIASFLVKVKETISNQNNLPDTQGCYLFQNQLGDELTVTVTRTDTSKSVTFKVPNGQEKTFCLDPGHYTYTVDAPAPWASITGRLDVKAGDRLLIPVKETTPEQANTPGASPTQSGSKPSPTNTPRPQPTAVPIPTKQAANCDPSYPDFCIPSPPPDLDCPDIPHKNFTVLPPDPHRFDRDHDGIGCEG